MTQPSLSDLVSSYESGAGAFQDVPTADAPMASADAPTAAPAAAPAANDRVASFVQRYRPTAERAAQQLGVSPDVLLGQWGLETGWGKSVIPGTNNLGNIKAPKGQGVQATDNMTGSRDGYRAYGSDMDFGDDYARLIGRSQRYKDAVGAGDDAQGYFSALKRGGYAEDPDYVRKGVSAVNLVRASMGNGSGELRRASSERMPEDVGSAAYHPSLSSLVSMYDTGPSLPQLSRREAPKSKSLLDNAGDLASATWSGVKDLGRSIMATGYTATGQLSDVELLAKAQQVDETQKPEEYQALIQEIQARKQANPDAPWWQALGDVGGAAWKNKLGTAQMVASQLPNSAAVLGGAWAGGKAGVALGALTGPAAPVAVPVLGTLGAIGGMFLGNYLVETGSKATQAAADGFTQEEADRALTEGAKKAAVITGVDMATLGIGNVASKAIFKSAAKAGAKAEMKVLADAGIDVIDPQAVIRALSTKPELAAAARSAGEAAAKAATTTGMRVAQAGGGMALESAGEGVGEYYGEVAATGQGDVYDAALEALSSMPQSAVETAFNYSTTQSNGLSPTGIVRAAAQQENSPISRALANSGVLDEVDRQQSGQAQQVAEQQPPQDPMLSFATNVEDMARQTRLLDQLDALGVEGSGRKDFLDALATVRNAKLDQRTPLLREQAKEDIERMVAMTRSPRTFQAGQAFQTMMPQTGSLQEQRAAEQSALKSAQAAGQQFQALGITDPAQDLRAQRESAAVERAAGVGQAWQQKQAGMQPEGETSYVVPMTGPSGETSSLADAPKAHTLIPAPPVQIPENGPGTAQVRKRKAEIGDLVAKGFDTITQDATGVTVLANQKTGEAHALTMAMDQKLVNDAIRAKIRAAEDQSPNSPNNDKSPSTHAQNQADNYLKPGVDLNGYRLRIENPVGSTRSGEDPDGKPWSVTMGSSYGYIEGTKAADGDGVDTYIGDAPESSGIFVIDQVNKDGTFDEPKVVMGVRSVEHAKQTYLSNFEKGWTGLGAITPMSREQFDAWLKRGGPLKPVDPAIPVANKPAQASTPAAAQAPTASAPATGSQQVAKLVKEMAGRDVEISEPSQDDRRLRAFTPLADAFEKVFGRRPVAVIATGDGAFDGVMVDGEYFVNLDAAQMPVAETIAHEFGHTQEDRAEVKRLEDAMMALVPEAVRKKYYGYIARTNDVAKVYKPDGSIDLDASYAAATAQDLALLRSEIIKDFMGKRFNDKAWLQRLAKAKPKEFGEFVKEWIALLDQLIAEFKGALSRAKEKDVDALMRSHIAELEGMKAIAVEVAAEWAKANPELAQSMGMEPQGDGSVRFAKRAGPIERTPQRQFLVPQVDGAFDAETGNLAILPAIEFGGPVGFKRFDSMPVRVRVGQHDASDAGTRQFGVEHRIGNAVTTTRRAFRTPEIGSGGEAVVERATREIALTVLTATEAYPGIKYDNEIMLRSPETGETLSLHKDFDSTGKPFWSVKTSIPMSTARLEGISGSPVSIKGTTLDGTDGSSSDAVVRETIEKLRSSVPILSDKASYTLTQEGRVVNPQSVEATPAASQEPRAAKRELPRDANGKIILKRSRQSARDIEPGVYGRPREGAVSAVGYHYSRQPRDVLMSAMYGTGLKGAERERLAGEDAADIRGRIHFYVDTGNGVRPESGVGGTPHRVELRNLYDANQDPLGLVRDAKPKDGEARANAWERAIMQAGFDGYLARNEGETQGQAVLIGRHAVMPVVGRPRAATQVAPRTAASEPPPPVTRRIGDRLIRRLVAGDFTEVSRARQMLSEMAPSFKVEFGEASASEREAEVVNTIMAEQGAKFRFSTRDLLPKDISRRLIVDLKSGGYKALDNDIVVVVPTADGSEARLTVNAREAMQQLDRREDALEHVKECLL